MFLSENYIYISLAAKDPEQLEENHDDIQVEDKCTDNVVINFKLVSSTTSHHLGVNQKEQAVENYKGASCKGVIHLSEGENKHGKQAHAHRDDDDQNESPTDKWTTKICKIVLGKPSVNCQTYCQRCSH